MKEYKENNFGTEYHVIEYGLEDIEDLGLIYDIYQATIDYKYLKIIDKVTNETNYYLDGMKHNSCGPAKILDVNGNKSEEFYIYNKKKEKNDELKNIKRSKLIDNMLNEKRKEA